MNVLTKIILSILTIFCLTVLVYFTFIAPNYFHNINTYTLISSGTYSIGDSGVLSPEIQSGSIKVNKLNNANNVYYTQGTVNIQNNTIDVEPGIYLFEFNEIETNYQIVSQDFEIGYDGPASFILNTNDEGVFKIFSISGKLNIIPKHQRISAEKEINIQVYPNMYFITNKNRAISYSNVDLNRVQQLGDYNAISGGIYFHPILLEDGKPLLDQNGKIQNDNNVYSLTSIIREKIFDNDTSYDNFIKDVYDYKESRLEQQREIFTDISKEQFYSFPGEDYISNYYQYFLNDEKKKYYYKNLILKKLILLSNGKFEDNDIDFVIEKLNKLKAISPQEYESMINVIQYYYEIILITQKNHPSILSHMNQLHKSISDIESNFRLDSLINLHYVYENKILGVPGFFNKNISEFMNGYSIELITTSDDKIQEKYSYYIYFIKNLILNESKLVNDYNNFVKIFEQYVTTFNDYIIKANSTEIETQIFNSAQLIDVFIQIIREVFFEIDKNDRNLLIEKTNPQISPEQYVVLKNNLKTLLNFYSENKNVIDDKSSIGTKEKNLLEKYNQNIDLLEEYFLAIDNYPEYELKYDTAVSDFDFGGEEDNSLSIQKAKEYLYQFQGSVTETAQIEIRSYPYCKTQNEDIVEDNSDLYCYHVKKIEIDGTIFSFILTPSEQNEISFLSYINDDNQVIKSSNNHVMDKIQETFLEEFEKSQSKERDKYDFSKFFTNNYNKKQVQVVVNNEETDIDIEPPVIDEVIGVEILKRSLLADAAPLNSLSSIMTVPYRYLIVERINNNYAARIFPRDFNATDNSSSKNDKFIGKFSADYIYDSDEHYFVNTILQPIDDEDGDEKYFILGDSHIDIQGKLYFTDFESELKAIGLKMTMIKYFYKEIKKIYGENTQIKIIFDIESKILILEYEDRRVEINDSGQANVYQNEVKILGPTRYSTIDL